MVGMLRLVPLPRSRLDHLGGSRAGLRDLAPVANKMLGGMVDLVGHEPMWVGHDIQKKPKTATQRVASI